MEAEQSAQRDLAQRSQTLSAKIAAVLKAHSALSSPASKALFPDDEVAAFANLERELELIERRTEARALEIGIIGQLNAGKSTLMNALAGRSLSPTSALPATGVFLRLDPRAKEARVIFLPDRRRRPLRLKDLSEVGCWITHDGNPANREGVDCVELPLEEGLLGPDVGITDTPGEGDILQAEPERLQLYLDERLDLALLVGSNASLWTRASFTLMERALRRCPLVILVANVDAQAQNLDESGQRTHARNDEALLARLRERLAESPRAPRALAEGSLRVHVLSAREAIEGSALDRDALDALREEVRVAAADPAFRVRRLSVLKRSLQDAEHAWHDRAQAWLTRCLSEIERAAKAAADAAAERLRAEQHRERTQRELSARAEDLVRIARADARETWESGLSGSVLRQARAWRIRRDAAGPLLEEINGSLAQHEAEIDARGAVAYEEAHRFAALLLNIGSPQPIKDFEPRCRATFEMLLGSPRWSGKFWLGLPIGILTAYLVAGSLTRQFEDWIAVPIVGVLLSWVLGVIVAVLIGWMIGAAVGAFAWRRLLRAGLPVLLKRMLVSGMDQQRLRPLQEMLVERAAARAEARAQMLLKQCEPQWRAAVAAVPEVPAAASTALARLRHALEDGLAC